MGNFMLTNTFLVFFMQAGFAMLCAGSVRSKNTKNILIKNVLDACVGAIAWFLFGYGFAFGATTGKKENAFIGSGNFAMKDVTTASELAMYLFQWSFSAAATTIVSGSVAERTKFEAYLGYSFFLTAFVYPVVVHWAWSGGAGWLGTGYTLGDKVADVGMHDFAGSGVVHMVGGFAGLMGAMIVGPRTGRFASDGRVNPMPGHSAPLVIIAWTCGTIGPFFMLMKKFNLLRTTVEEETLGLDESKHGGKAYAMELVAPEPA